MKKPLPLVPPADAASGALPDLVVQASVIVREDVAVLQALTRASDVEPLDRAGNDAYRFHEIEAIDGVVEACSAAGYDCALVPPTRALSRVRVIAMDMDSTLITIECIDEIADMQGLKPQVSSITAAAMRGEIDFPESLRRRVALLAGLPVTALGRVYDERLKLSPGAERMLAGFRAVGAKTMLVSGGFTFFTDRLKARLGLDATLANVLDVDGEKLTGKIVGDIVDGAAKGRALRALAERVRGGDGIVAAIGDGANDLPLLEAADVSIAYHAKPIVRERATHAIDHNGLDAVLNLFF
jgi:phosphoserine phosphatase